MIRRGDLMDRSLSITLEAIADEHRRTEADVDAMFLQVQPGLLAALADAVSQALKAPVKLTSMPRMADFATTVESAAPALGWKPGAFLKAYTERRASTIDILLDNDLVALALELLREQREPDATKDALWEGTSEELREAITQLVAESKREKLPKSGKGMIGALRRLAPGLRGKQVDVQLPKGQETSGDRRGQRVIRIAWKGEQPSLPGVAQSDARSALQRKIDECLSPADQARLQQLRDNAPKTNGARTEDAEFAPVTDGANPYAHADATGATDESPF